MTSCVGLSPWHRGKESELVGTAVRGSDPATACAAPACKCRLCGPGFGRGGGRLSKSALMLDNNTTDKTKYAPGVLTSCQSL